MKEVVRLIAVVVDEKKAKITLTADDVAVTKEIENVVGGEKSFEALEGQTEESYDLMAKRSEDVEKDTKPKKDIEEPSVELPPETDKKDDAEVSKEEPKEKAPEKKPAVKRSKPADDQPKEEKATKKSVKKATPKKAVDSKATDEADRLSKLDKELDDLLGDDL